MRSARHILLTTAALLAWSLAAHSTESTIKLNIQTQPMVEALNAFAQQTGLQLIFPAEEIAAKVIAPQLAGEYTPQAALDRLLANSGLVYSYVNERTIAIRASKADAPVKTGNAAGGAVLTRQAALHMARANTTAAAEVMAAAAEDDKRPANGDDKEKSRSSEMVVTGSHIRGVRNDTVPLVTFDREYIERSGFSNTIQLIQALPMHFKGGDAGASEEGVFGGGGDQGRNLNRGTGLNLRGLGTVSTLTLINGRRVAPSADGQFVDVSTIPLSAIERIEILTDGASAVYGADAVAGVVNIILRDDFNGAQTSLRYGSTTTGGLDEQHISQTIGRNWGSGDGLLIAEYYKRDPLLTSDRDYVLSAGAPANAYLLPERNLLSATLSANQDLPGGFDVMTNMMYATEDVVSIYSDVGEAILTSSHPQTDRWSATAGLGYEPFGDWRFSLEGIYSYGEINTDVILADPMTGVPFVSYDGFSNESTTWTADLKADGTLFRTAAGPIRLAAGLSYRDDDIYTVRAQVFYDEDGIPTSATPQVRADDRRDVQSVFAELFIPVVGESRQLSWAQRINLSLSSRYDKYSDFGSTFNPRFGLMWSPAESLEFRASYSTSFRAPSVLEKSRGTGPQFAFTWDFASPDGMGRAPIIMLSGALPLQPEESENISVGFTWRPAAIKGLNLTLNYFDIDYRNRIISPPFDDGALVRRAEFGALITEFSSDTEVLAFVNERLALGDIFLDQTEPYEDTPEAAIEGAGIRYLYDWRQKNAGRTQTSGFDLTAGYTFDRGEDIFDLSLNVARLNEILVSLTADSTAFDEIDNFQRPLDWRLRGMGTWTRGGLSTTMVVSYADDYVNTSLFTDAPVGSWTTMDLNVAYSFSNTASMLLNDARVGLNISNLFDERPPRALDLLSSMGYDVANANAMDRFVTMQYSKRW